MCCSSIYCKCNFLQHKPQQKMADALANPWWESPGSQYNPLWQSFHKVRNTSMFGPCICEIPPVYLTAKQVKEIVKEATLSNIMKHIDHLNKAMYKYEIRTPLRIAHFIAQVAHESGRFAHTREIADGSKYEGRIDLGNIHKGDGKLFRGRGLIQITGRENYTKYSNYAGQNFTEGGNAIKLEQEPWASDSAGWFWHIYTKLNPLADTDDLLKITKKINGGYTGLPERRKLLTRAKAVLNIQQHSTLI